MYWSHVGLYCVQNKVYAKYNPPATTPGLGLLAYHIAQTALASPEWLLRQQWAG